MVHVYIIQANNEIEMYTSIERYEARILILTKQNHVIMTWSKDIQV